jgi:hypothetical protein
VLLEKDFHSPNPFWDSHTYVSNLKHLSVYRSQFHFHKITCYRKAYLSEQSFTKNMSKQHKYIIELLETAFLIHLMYPQSPKVPCKLSVPFFLVVLGIELRALCMLSIHSNIELYPQTISQSLASTCLFYINLFSPLPAPTTTSLSAPFPLGINQERISFHSYLK